jgi:hypothetical protein
MAKQTLTPKVFDQEELLVGFKQPQSRTRVFQN